MDGILKVLTKNGIFLWTSLLAPMGMLCISKNNRIKVFFILVYLFALLFFFIKKRKNTSNSNSVFIDENVNVKALVLSLILDGIVLFDLHQNLKSCIPGVLYKISIIPAEISLILVGFAGCIVGLYGLYILSINLLKIINPIYELLLKYRNQFLILFLINILGIITILRENIYYADDMLRVKVYYSMSGDFSRYISEFLSNLLHGSIALCDVSPLPQIIAVLFLSLTGIIIISELSKEICDSEKINTFAIISFIIFSLSPYFLSCLSYKYDAPYMALSVLASVLPFIYRSKSSFAYGLVCFACMLIVCTTYQASSGIFPITVVLLALIMWLKKDELSKILKFVLISAIGYVAGMLCFRLLLMENKESSYVDTGIAVDKVFSNIINYFKLIISDSTVVWIVLIVFVFVFSFGCFVFKSKQNKCLTVFLVLILMGVMSVLSLGVYLILSQPLTQIRAMYGFPYFIALLGMVISLLDKKYVGKVSVCFLSWMFFTFSFVYGNALAVQQEYVSLRIEQTLADLEELEILNSNENVKFHIDAGDSGVSPVVRDRFEDFPVLERGLIHGDWYDCKMRLFYDLNLEEFEKEEKEGLSKLDLPVLKDTAYHTIKGKDNIVLIEFK